MTTTASSTITALVVENKRQNLVVQRLPWEPQKYVFTIVDTFDRIQLLCFQCEISLSNATKSELEHFYLSPHYSCSWDNLETDVLQSCTVKINCS